MRKAWESGVHTQSHRVVVVLLRITWILSKGKESSKRKVKIGTMPSLKKDEKAIKVFPGC